MGNGGSDHANAAAANLFSPLGARYDLLCEVLSMGQNRRWRRALVDRVQEVNPKRVLDVASGTAGIALQIARRTGAEVIAYDLTLPMLEKGRERIGKAHLHDQVVATQGRAERMPFADGSFDVVTFSYLLRYVADPAATLAELSRVITPGGSLLSLEFLAPPGAPWRMAWWLYTRVLLPPAGWVLGGSAWWRVGRFLGPSISGHYRAHPLEWLQDAWRSAGIPEVSSRVMSLGGGLIMWGHKSGG
ncbi:MAG: class I SAM-dependent methyltransferase [Acidimicrobiales bacterium]